MPVEAMVEVFVEEGCHGTGFRGNDGLLYA